MKVRMGQSTNDFIKQLAKEQQEKANAVVKQARTWLSKSKYYEYDLDEKIEFLRSSAGQTLLRHLCKSKIAWVDIASLLNMSQKQLFDLKREYWEIHDAYESGRAEALGEIEQSMFQLANGYTVQLETKREVAMPDGTMKETTETKDQYIPKNFLAIKYLLEQMRALEFQNEQAKREIDRNRIPLEIVIIGQDELETD